MCTANQHGADSSAPESGLKRDLWRSIFQEFLQPRLGFGLLVMWLRLRPSRFGCRRRTTLRALRGDIVIFTYEAFVSLEGMEL